MSDAFRSVVLNKGSLGPQGTFGELSEDICDYHI